jgi:hypothetical protein
MYIYLTRNLINNKIYIGLSAKRKEDNPNYFGSGSLIRAAISKYGKDNFIKEILEDNVETLELLQEKEIYWIKYYRSTSRDVGYNIAVGGTGGDTLSNHPDLENIKKRLSQNIKKSFTPEVREKMSNASKLVWSCPKLRAEQSARHKGHAPYPNQVKAAKARKGTHLSEEHKQKLSIAKTGTSFSKEINLTKGRKGYKVYHNPELGISTRSNVHPGEGWVPGQLHKFTPVKRYSQCRFCSREIANCNLGRHETKCGSLVNP